MLRAGLLFIFICSLTQAQTLTETLPQKKQEWFERVNFRGYTQFRYNRLFETNPEVKCEQCDKSIGDNGGFFIRRARMIFFGEMNNNVYFYIQPDLASAPEKNQQHFNQLRDLYFDIALTDDKSSRLRFGQSKVPFGFENLQSSSNRLAMDRNDGLNSAVANERDIGVNYYWASPEKRKLLSELTKNNLKGTGDYGIFGIGAYNGQTANKPEKNNNLHIVSRFTYPTKLASGQIIEPSIQGYHGYYVANTGTEEREYLDERIAASFIFYPQPIGFQMEYNEGVGPEYDEDIQKIDVKKLKGGYAQIMYNHQIGKDFYMPFIKYQFYEGGKKHETGATSYQVKAVEVGVEWQYGPYFEITALYAYDERVMKSALIDSDEKGSKLRLQLQVNY